MLSGDSFVSAGWVHNLQLHKFLDSSGEKKFVIMGKVSCRYTLSYKSVNMHQGEAFTKIRCRSPSSVGNFCA